MPAYTRAAITAASALTLALTATACSSDESGSTAETADGAGTSTSIELEKGWAKATDTEMSGVFGVIRNTNDEDVHLTGVSGEIDGSHELHETVPGGGAMMMQEREEGFVIPTGGELALEPGGDHIMLMGLTEPITTGQQIVLTLEFADREDREVTVSARSFEGGEENYAPGGGHEGGHDDGADGHDDEQASQGNGGAEHDG